MKRRVLLFALLAVLCIGGMVAWKYRARLFHGDDASDLYVLYRGCPDIEADYIRRMRVDGATAVDVTVLHAADSNAWRRLTDDFAVPPATHYEDSLAATGRDVTRLTHYAAGLPQPATGTMQPVVAVSPARRTITVFHATDRQQRHAIIYYNFDKSHHNVK